MIAVKFLKRLLMGASRGPKHRSTCRPIFDIYSVNKLGLRHTRGETKPLMGYITSETQKEDGGGVGAFKGGRLRREGKHRVPFAF